MLAGYCAGWSLRTLLNEGFNGIPGASRRARRSTVQRPGADGQLLGTLQNEWAGAQAFSSFDTYLAPFVRKDRLGYDEVRQAIQEFIYNLNVPSRWGTQTPFTNLTFDWVCPEDLREQIPTLAARKCPAYGELQAEMELINRAYIEVMQAGDGLGRVFTFPDPDLQHHPRLPWDSDNAERLFEMTARYGLPYFQNFSTRTCSPTRCVPCAAACSWTCASCLRGGGLFGSAEQTGSLGVVTINCARLGYLYRGDKAVSAGAAGSPAGDGAAEPGGQAQGHPAAYGCRALPLHQALPRHPAQSLLHHRRERPARDAAQLHR